MRIALRTREQTPEVYGGTRSPAPSHTSPRRKGLSIDLVMAARAQAAELVHRPHVVREARRARAKLIYDMPRVATVHSPGPLRPCKAEQPGGGYALSSLRERVGLEGADAVIAARSECGAHPRQPPRDQRRGVSTAYQLSWHPAG